MTEAAENYGVSTAQPTERSLVKLRPDLRTRLEGQQTHALAAIAERWNEEASPSSMNSRCGSHALALGECAGEF